MLKYEDVLNDDNFRLRIEESMIKSNPIQALKQNTSIRCFKSFVLFYESILFSNISVNTYSI